MVELSWARDQWLAKQREADRARCQYWDLRMSERGPAQPSPTIRRAMLRPVPGVTCTLQSDAMGRSARREAAA
jgi:hypothetical protein